MVKLSSNGLPLKWRSLKRVIIGNTYFGGIHLYRTFS